MSNTDFNLLFEVDKLGPNPKRIHINASKEELKALCERFDLLDMSFFKGEAMLQRLSGKKIECRYTASSEFEQQCVVTFKPVKKRIELEFSRIYDTSVNKEKVEKEVEIDIDETDELDPVIDGVIDLGQAVSEEFGLELDPFPRADGADFTDYGVGPEITEEEVKSNNPFAVLEGLKNKSE